MAYLIKDQKHFPFSGHFFNSHNLFFSLYIDIVKRKLILVTLWTERVSESLSLVDHSQRLNLSKFSPHSFFNLPQLQCWLQNSFRGPYVRKLLKVITSPSLNEVIVLYWIEYETNLQIYTSHTMLCRNIPWVTWLYIRVCTLYWQKSDTSEIWMVYLERALQN